MLEDGALRIKNCSGATMFFDNGVARQVLVLFDHIALGIQRDGAFPPVVAYTK